MGIATVTTKGQITIPRDVRKTLGIGQGDKLLFMLEGGRAVLVRLAGNRSLSELYGSLPATRPYPGHDAIRQEIHADLAERIQRGAE
jgi:antitoxin PrlF